MINSIYYENTTMSTTEGSYTEESSKQIEKKLLDLSLENISVEKEKFIEKITKIIEEIIQENKILNTNEDISKNETENEKDFEFIENNIDENNIIANEIKYEELDEKRYIENLFYLKKTPNITLSKYIQRINKYLDPEISTIIISLIYIDQITSSENYKIKINENNVFKIILTSINIAIKYNEDDFNDNVFVAKVGGISLEELNELELNFCALLNWDLFIYENNFRKYYEHLLGN